MSPGPLRSISRAEEKALESLGTCCSGWDGRFLLADAAEDGMVDFFWQLETCRFWALPCAFRRSELCVLIASLHWVERKILLFVAFAAGKAERSLA
ncbi:hypothetical protein NDU88_004915 [Pleurodeles waltl]|uniref:Uncharacterized protein n=1 Tax=Pleurodeles waltl TaxID=8319 RepID=A0AAV7W977_PLEWA|nr:hypothetical protein NDU88_004915 [Pleurodeles waltl]